MYVCKNECVKSLRLGSNDWVTGILWKVSYMFHCIGSLLEERLNGIFVIITIVNHHALKWSCQKVVKRRTLNLVKTPYLCRSRNVKRRTLNVVETPYLCRSRNVRVRLCLYVRGIHSKRIDTKKKQLRSWS